MNYKTRVSLILSATAIVALTGAYFFVPYQIKRVKANLKQEMKKAAVDERKKLPKRTGDWEMHSIEAVEDTMVYGFRLVEKSMTKSDFVENQLAMKESELKGVCRHPILRYLYLKQGVSLHFVYTNVDSSYLGKVEVNPWDCK